MLIYSPKGNALTDGVVYERSKGGNMKEINSPDFKCLGFIFFIFFFLETRNGGFRSSVGLFSRLLVSWLMHFSAYPIHCLTPAKSSEAK